MQLFWRIRYFMIDCQDNFDIFRRIIEQLISCTLRMQMCFRYFLIERLIMFSTNWLVAGLTNDLITHAGTLSLSSTEHEIIFSCFHWMCKLRIHLLLSKREIEKKYHKNVPTNLNSSSCCLIGLECFTCTGIKETFLPSCFDSYTPK